MVKRIGLLILVVTLGVAVAADAALATGSIAGLVRDGEGRSLPNARLQLRNVDTGVIVDTTVAGADGSYKFFRLPQGNYMVEIVDGSYRVVGVATAALPAGGAVTGLSTTATAVGTAAAAAQAGGAGAFFASTAGIVLLAWGAIGVTAAIIATTNDASPSR